MTGVGAAAERFDLWAPFLTEPSATGVFADFDGTLSPIVDDPEDAVLAAGLYPVLEELASRLGLVEVITGRSAEFLIDLLPPGVSISGLHGLERVCAQGHSVHPLAGVWREVVEDVSSLVRERGPGGLRVEDKGVSLTFHYRAHPELADQTRRFAERQAARSGLVCHETRMGYALHPPIGIDDGILDQASGLGSVCYMGDDHTDLAGFDALDHLAATGVHAVRVAVDSAECPGELRERADVRLGGPAEVVELLRFLAESISEPGGDSPF